MELSQFEIDDLFQTVKAVTRKSRYYDTGARTGITKTDCTKPKAIQNGSLNGCNGNYI